MDMTKAPNLKKYKLRIVSFRGEFGFLSNFHPCKVMLSGTDYPSVEHAFQAGKTRSPTERLKILNAPTPGEARRLGQEVDLRPDWEDVKIVLMKFLVRKKFNRDPVLAQQLLDTGDAELIEGNHWKDRFWGVYRGKGRNHLGKILMEVRAELREKANQENGVLE